MIDHEIMPFGMLLHQFRKRVHFTQQQLANEIGMHRHAIGRWEQGEMLPASKAIVLELARRLQLNDQETRQLLDASMTAPAPLWAVPYPRNQWFTGQEDTLKMLHTHLHAEQTDASLQISALCGMGGIGKTQIALEYAYQHALEYRAVFWVEAETPERVRFSIQRIAEVLQLPERVTTDYPRLVEAVKLWLVTQSKWLFIWDNLEDLHLLSSLLASGRHGAHLLTTRHQALGTLARGIPVPPLAHHESIFFLLRRAKILEREATYEQAQSLARLKPEEYSAASQLATLLAGLPLALDQMGAYIEETGCSLNAYLRLYEQHQAPLLARRGEAGTHHPESVTTTIMLSQQRAEREQEGAADLLRICAFLHPEAIPEELFTLGAEHLGSTLATRVGTPLQFDALLAALRHLSLVQRQAETQTLSLHRLTQVVLREQMEPTEKRVWHERTIRLLHTAFPTGDFPTWERCERYLPHVLACISGFTGNNEDLPEARALLARVGRYLLQRGRFSEAETLLARAVAFVEQAHGPDHLALLPLLTIQVELLWKQGKYTLAEALSSRLLSIEKQHLAPNHLHIADTLNTLALLYCDQGHYEQAEPLIQQALRIYEEHNHPERICILNNLAVLYRDQGKYAQVEALLQRVLKYGKPELEPEHPERAFSMNNLAVLYREQGKYEQAEALFQQALHIREQGLGPHHPDVALLLSNLAMLFHQQGKHIQAERLFQRALRIQKRTFGLNHRQTAASLHGLAVLYQAQRQDSQAETLFHQALSIRKQLLGSSHPDVAASMTRLAMLYASQDKIEQAEALFQQALHIQEQTLEPEHLQIALTLDGMAALRAQNGHYAQARLLNERVLAIRSEHLEPCHLDTARTLVNLARLYEREGEKEQADLLLQRAEVIFKQHPDQDYPQIITFRYKHQAVCENK